MLVKKVTLLHVACALLSASSVDYALAQKVVTQVLDVAGRAAKMAKAAQEPDKYSGTQAEVRIGTNLSLQEQNFLNNRYPITKTAIQKLISSDPKKPMVIPASKMPRIALCFSGGGFRAMIETLGFLAGAQAVGLLDAATYATGLSGSTWALMPWTISGKRSVMDYIQALKPKINKKKMQDYTPDEKGLEEIGVMFLRKWFDGQHISLTDIYGSILANALLEGIVPQKQNYTIAQIGPVIRDGSYPMPISTAVGAGKLTNVWFEWSAFEVGSHQFGAFVPVWAFGREFVGGISARSKTISVNDITTKDGIVFAAQRVLGGRGTPYARPQTLGFFMGIWGSAFAANFDMAYHEILGKRLMSDMGEKDIEALKSHIELEITARGQGKLLGQSFGAAQVPNYTYQLKDPKTGLDLPYAAQQKISLVDGGYDLVDSKFALNLAVVPLLRPERNVDIIIMCDSSGNLQKAPSLQAAQARARALGFKFPAMSPDAFEDIDTKLVSVFWDAKDPSVPTVIYLPCIKNESYDPAFDPTKVAYTSTMNFCYTPEQVTELSGLIAKNIQDSMGTVIKTIREVIARKPGTVAQKNAIDAVTIKAEQTAEQKAAATLALWKALGVGDVNGVAQAIGNGAAISSPLIQAGAGGKGGFTKEQNFTPLFAASLKFAQATTAAQQNNYFQIISLLLQHGAARTINDLSAATAAADAKIVPLMGIIVRMMSTIKTNMAQVDWQNLASKTQQAITLFVQNGAVISGVDQNKKNMLHMIAGFASINAPKRGAMVKIAEQLIASFKPSATQMLTDFVGAQDNNGDTPLAIAQRKNFTEFASKLASK